jgi:acetyl-CoA C-acetyltransferase
MMADTTPTGRNGGVYLVSAARTPIGKFGGALADVPAVELGGVAIHAAVERSGLPANATVDEVLMGQVLQAGAGQAPARQAALRGGLPVTASATTINRVCGSALKAIMLGAAEIRAGDAEVVVAGGMESMNGAPYLLPRARFGYRLGDGTLVDATVHDGLWCAVEGCHMGTHAERVAISNEVSRQDQDEFALRSHQRAIAAIDEGRFEAEIAPVTVRDAKGRDTVVAVDEGPRRDSTIEALARLKPVFALPEGEDRGKATDGTVTAGNAPGVTDGAAATVVASERAVERYGLKPLARIVGYAQAEVEPRWLFLAPVEGVRRLLDRIELPIEAFDLIEINEAFAAQTLADGRELGFDWDRVNVNGGAIALGHPIGASGARIVATLLYELQRRQGRYGLATLCLGGGGSVAMAFERV